jgi:hypothetical protein
VIGEVKVEKLTHKLTLICVKYIPILVAIVELLGTVLSFLNIGTILLAYLFGSSVVTLIPMYIMSYAFKFCKYHRMVLNYIVANKLIFMLNYLFVIPLSATGFIATTITLAGIFLALTIYNYLKYGDRNNT